MMSILLTTLLCSIRQVRGLSACAFKLQYRNFAGECVRSLPGLKQEQLLSIKASIEKSHVIDEQAIAGEWQEQCLTFVVPAVMSILPLANVANAVNGITRMQSM